MSTGLFTIKLAHSLIFWFQVTCLAYLLYAGITRTFNSFVLIGQVSISLNGLALILNGGRCPFTTLAEAQGAQTGSVTDMYLPHVIARNVFRVSVPIFAAEVILLGVRYFWGI